MGYLVEMSVSAFFLVCALAVGAVCLWRVRALERRISILLHAALTNTREIRQCIGRVEDGFGGLRKSENQRRLMLASLNSQMSDLNRMLTRKLAAEPSAVPPQAANARRPAPVVADQPVHVARAAAPGAPLPGYRTVRKEAEADAIIENGQEASRQRKIRTIEQFFDRVAGAEAAEASDERGQVEETNVTRLHAAAKPEKEAASASVGLAEVFSQRRRVVNG